MRGAKKGVVRMNPVVVRGVRIGEGIPKVCVPIVGRTYEEIIEQAKHIRELDVDMIEWRADWYADIFVEEKRTAVLKELRGILEECPILFTFRSKREGGEQDIAEEAYYDLNASVIESGCVDFIDVEVFSQASVVEKLVVVAHEKSVCVIGSNHDFYQTPAKEEMIRRFQCMQAQGADVLKIAVMPQNMEDVLTLLDVTQSIEKYNIVQPVVTMSMGKAGMVSRISGEIFGSAVSFGSAGSSSAPGQVPAKQLKLILEQIHSILK